MATIAILGTMDTKGEEHAFVAEQIRRRGHQVLIIDVGTLGEPSLKPDVTRQEVAATTGANLSAVVQAHDARGVRYTLGYELDVADVEGRWEISAIQMDSRG